MFKHAVEVNGKMLKGAITADILTGDYIFNCKDIKPVQIASEMRALAIELNQVASELERLNGKSTLTR